MVSFCIGCTACLGCFEEQITHNDLIVRDFEDMWLKFINGKQVLAALGEQEVRRRLKILQSESTAEHDKLGANACADLLLPLAVEAFKTGAWVEKESRQAFEMQQEADLRAEEYWREEMQQEANFRAECEAEFLQQNCNSDPLWQELREQHRAARACRGSARRAHLEAKATRLRKQQRYPKPSKKVRVHRSDKLRCIDVGAAHSLEAAD
jgi:hypothetical protein